MTRSALVLLLALTSLAGCYRTIRVRATRSVVRPAPIASGTYWTTVDGEVVSTGMASSTDVAGSVSAEPPAIYVDGSLNASVSIEGQATTATVLSGASAGSWSADGGWNGGASAGGASAGGVEVVVSTGAASGGAAGSGAAASGVDVVASSGAAVGGAAGGGAAGGGAAVGGAAGGGAAVGGAGELRYGVDVAGAAPALGVALTGAGVRLEAIADVGIAVDCARASCVSGGVTVADGEIAALARLVPLGGGALSADAVVGADANVRIEAALAHEGLPAAGGATEVIVRVRGGEAPAAPPPLRIHLVIDASTSMEVRWDAVKDAALALVGTLRADDELQIVVYGTDARVALPACRVGDGARARRVIRDLSVGGRTNIEAGLRAAYADAAPSGGSIVLLLSDGVPQGGAASAAELSAITAEAWRARGTSTVAVGLGFDFDAEVLRAVATAGHGSFRIAPRIAELPALLSGEIEAHGRIVARDVAVEVALAPGVTLDAEVAASMGIEVVDGAARIRVPALSAGAELTFALPVVVARSAVGHGVATVSASWSSAASAHGTGTKDLSVARASRAAPAGSLRASLDLELSVSLELAAEAVANGEAERAAELLEAHAAEVEGVLAAHADAALRERAEASRALSWALRAHVPTATWPERRATAARILAWSVSLGR